MAAARRGHAIAVLAESLAPAGLSSRLEAARRLVAGPIVFTTSFGLEDQAITHAIFAHDPDLDIAVITLDTGRQFPETYEVWAETERRYGRRIQAFVPEAGALQALVLAQGIAGFRASIDARKACCGVRKVEPLRRALAGASAWITGLRAEQSAYRSATPLVELAPDQRLVKINLLADWTRADVERYVAENTVPYNSLHDRGYPSIGCAPCTRAVRVGEPERAGRWWWENEANKECGLHSRNGRLEQRPELAA